MSEPLDAGARDLRLAARRAVHHTARVIGQRIGLAAAEIDATAKRFDPIDGPSGPLDPLPATQATLIFAYALASLSRTSADTVAGGREVGALLGLSASDIDLLMPTALHLLPRRTPLAPAVALWQFFDPEAPTRAAAARLMTRLEVRRGRTTVAHVPPAAYEHPTDRAALDAIRAVPGIETLFRKMSELSIERAIAIESIAQRVRVDHEQFPEIYALFCEAVEMLGMPVIPDLYLELGPPNARTVGIDRPQVILSHAMPALCSRDELLFVMGHELGHIRSGHTPFQMARMFLPQVMDMMGQVTLGIGNLVGVGVEALLFDWYRKSEFTCDRCGLLVCQNLDAARSVMLKLAGAPPSMYAKMNIDAFVRQAEDYDALDRDALSKTYKFLRTAFGAQDHPWLAVRAREIGRWALSGEYERLLGRRPPASAATCASCATALAPGDRFCDACGTPAPRR